MGNPNQQQGGGGDRPRQQEQSGSDQKVKPRDDEGMSEGDLDAGNIASPDAGQEKRNERQKSPGS